MAKNKIIVFYLFFTVGSFGVFGRNAERVELVAKIYTAEIGVREQTGKNDGPRVEEYLASCGIKKGAKNNKTPGKADVFGIWFQNLNRIAHVGFIDEWKDDCAFCITVEGNTNDEGSREGDGVYKKRRLKSQIYKVSRWL